MDYSKSAETMCEEILPIEQRKIKGKLKHIVAVIPALDERWVSERKFGYYLFPPCKLQNGSYISGAKDIWLVSMSSVLDDIWWLCELQYHKFWSQLMYDKNATNGIKSFLHLTTLQKLYCKTEDTEVLTMYKRVKKAVFQFLNRISRSKESEMHFMSDDKYREIMSKNDLVPLSLLFCICTIYGKKRKEYVRGFVSNMFAYNENLKFDHAIMRTIQLFSRLKKKLKISHRELKRSLMYSDNQRDVCETAIAYRKCLFSTSQFLANAAINISNFLTVYREGCDVFLEHDFPFHIVRVYKKLLIPVCQEVDVLFEGSCHQQTRSWLNSVLDLTRLEFVKIFDLCLIAMAEQLSNSRTAYDIVQRYVRLMKISSKNKDFLADANEFSDLCGIAKNIKKVCPGNIDLTEADRIAQTIGELLKSEARETWSKNDILDEKVDDIFDYVKECYDSDENASDIENSFDDGADDGILSDSDLSSNYSDWSQDENSNSEYESYLTSSAEEEDELTDFASKEAETTYSKSSQFNLPPEMPSTSRSQTELMVSQVELQSAISHVKDLLSHLGDGFIAICLEYYKMDVSAVISNVLEDTLPMPLKSVDFSLSTVPSYIYEKTADMYETVACNSDRKTQNDVKELKKPEYSNYNEMLNDKNEIRGLKTFYQNYKNVEEDELYNDDVDEDYEEEVVPFADVDTEGLYDKYTDLPLFNQNRQYMLPSDTPCNDFSDEESPSGPPADNVKPLDFCENPEIVRARRENQRNAAQQRRNQRTNYRNNNLGKRATEIYDAYAIHEHRKCDNAGVRSRTDEQRRGEKSKRHDNHFKEDRRVGKTENLEEKLDDNNDGFPRDEFLATSNRKNRRKPENQKNFYRSNHVETKPRTENTECCIQRDSRRDDEVSGSDRARDDWRHSLSENTTPSRNIEHSSYEERQLGADTGKRDDYRRNSKSENATFDSSRQDKKPKFGRSRGEWRNSSFRNTSPNRKDHSNRGERQPIPDYGRKNDRGWRNSPNERVASGSKVYSSVNDGQLKSGRGRDDWRNSCADNMTSRRKDYSSLEERQPELDRGSKENNSWQNSREERSSRHRKFDSRDKYGDNDFGRRNSFESGEDRSYQRAENRDKVDNVAYERHQKTIFKSKNANHDRKFLSDRKRRF